MQFRFIYTILFISIALAGCASTGVVPIDSDTYMISKQSAAGIFGTPNGVMADIYKEANAYCARTGKTIETVNAKISGAIPFVREGSATLQFKCVSK
ncbi:MAG: hypothetical protein ACYCSR_05640 [Thiomonas sp.]